MIKYMVIEIWPKDRPFLVAEVEIVAFNLSNIQTAEAERTMYLEDNPNVSPDNVSVVQYKE